MPIQVQVPEFAEGGTVLSVTAPDGTPFQIVVPKGAAPGVVLTVNTPAEMAQPQAQTMAARGPPLSGEVYAQVLGNVPGMLMRQKLFICEEFNPCVCERQNIYKMAAWHPSMPQLIPDGMLKELPAMTQVRERSSFAERLCFNNSRAYAMAFYPPEAENVRGTGWIPSMDPWLILDRPFECPYGLCCCFYCGAPTVTARVPGSNRLLGSATMDSCFEVDHPFACTITTKIRDANGVQHYTMRAPIGCGRNFLAPTCLNEQFVIDIVETRTARVVGSLTNMFPGLCRGIVAYSPDNYRLVFPPEATPEVRAALLGGLFIYDMLIFEAPK